MKKIAIIGGGAAGFFAAINIKMAIPSLDVTIYESHRRVLTKVGISGGGRCNLTNSFAQISNLSKAYPRGDKLIKRAFNIFDYKDTFEWFQNIGIRLVTQDDECVFPRSQDSQEIIDKFLQLSKELGVKVECNHKITHIKKETDTFYLQVNNDPNSNISADIVLITTGGYPHIDKYNIFSSIPIKIVQPVPSLFSFNIADKKLKELMGIVIPDTIVGIQGSKIKADGALLITHWGVSGPAILKLSSYSARELKDNNYKGNLIINWIGVGNEELVRDSVSKSIQDGEKKFIGNIKIGNLTNRVWEHILQRADISTKQPCSEIGSKGVNRIVAKLTSDEYPISGKSTDKEEFVTCGGISLSSINMSTLEAKECNNLYFAGEILDIDAITGGYNLQAAWSTAYTVVKSIIDRINSENNPAKQ